MEKQQDEPSLQFRFPGKSWLFNWKALRKCIRLPSERTLIRVCNFIYVNVALRDGQSSSLVEDFRIRCRMLFNPSKRLGLKTPTTYSAGDLFLGYFIPVLLSCFQTFWHLPNLLSVVSTRLNLKITYTPYQYLEESAVLLQ